MNYSCVMGECKWGKKVWKLQRENGFEFIILVVGRWNFGLQHGWIVNLERGK